MKRHWLLTALGAILAGAGLHFLWQALPNPLLALISPVNESVCARSACRGLPLT